MDSRCESTIHPLGVRTASEFEAALREALEQRVDFVAVLDTPFLAVHRPRLVEFAAKHRLPSVSRFSAYPESGFLMSYGTSPLGLWRRAAHYVDRLLRGAKPADLPVEQPTKYELVLNLLTATVATDPGRGSQEVEEPPPSGMPVRLRGNRIPDHVVGAETSFLVMPDHYLRLPLEPPPCAAPETRLPRGHSISLSARIRIDGGIEWTAGRARRGASTRRNDTTRAGSMPVRGGRHAC